MAGSDKDATLFARNQLLAAAYVVDHGAFRQTSEWFSTVLTGMGESSDATQRDAAAASVSLTSVPG